MGVGVGLGLADFPFSGIGPLWRWVALCEEGGVDSIWQTDRLVSAQPYLECMSLMAALAGATKRIKFGMNVACLGWREPLLLAKQCATIDVLSGGRLLPAFGVGSPRGAEWGALGRPLRGHGTRVDEALEILARLWTEESVDFEGTHHRLNGARIEPKPIQRRFPLWVGGASKAAIRRTARFGTGWLGGAMTPTDGAVVVAAIKREAERVGRTIPDDHYGVGLAYRRGSRDDGAVQDVAAAYREVLGVDPEPRIVVGGADEVIARVDAFVAAGIFKFVLRPIGAGDDDVIDQTRWFIEHVQPRLPG